MWAEATFQVALQDADTLTDDHLDVIQGYPGIGTVSVDSGRQLVLIAYDPQKWHAGSLMQIIEDAELPWIWLPAKPAA